MKLPLSILALAALAGGAAAAPAPNWNRGVPIDVSVSNTGFTPARIAMRRGRHYVLRIHNRSDRRHNFSAPQFFRIAGVAPRDARWVTDNKVDLRAGQSALIHILAPDTPNAVYAFRSTNLLDAGANLKGEISVR